MDYRVPIDDDVPLPSTFAFSWLSGLLLYGTIGDDGSGAGDTWLLTHPDLRLIAALTVGMGTATEAARELVEDGETVERGTWNRFAPALMAHLRGLLPHGLDSSRPFTALRHSFPEGVDRQTVVFVPGVRGEIIRTVVHPFGLTVEPYRRAWRVVDVQRQWMMPEWFLDADDELPSDDRL